MTGAGLTRREAVPRRSVREAAARRITRGWVVASALLVLAGHARAETAAWNGYRALGVPDEQVALLEYVTTNALDDPGLIERVIADGKVAERCGADVACHCAAIRKHGVRYGAYGSMGKLGNSWTVELTLIDAHTCTVSSSSYFDETLADELVGPRVAALAREVGTRADEIAATATGTGEAKPIDATPAVITTFTRAQLRALHLRTIDELFPLVPGFDVVDASWGGMILNQGLPSTLLFLADGVPLVNGLSQFRSTGRDFRTSFAHVDRIEIVRGPGAVLWGQNAYLGVVNVIGETPRRRQAAVDAGLLVGSHDTQEVWVRGAQNRGRYAFAASVDVGRHVGPEIQVPDSPQAVIGVSPVPFGNGGVTHPRADRWLDAYVRLAFDDRLELTVQNLTSDYNFEISTRGPLLDEGSGGWWKKTHRIYALVGTQPLHEAEGARLTLRGAASRYELYSWESFAVQPRWDDGPEPMMGQRDLRLGLRSLQGNDDPRLAHQGDVRVIHDYDLGWQNRLTAGVGVLHLHTPDSLATLVGIDEDPATHTVSFTEKNFVTLSGFAFDELTPRPWLVLDAGARLQADKPYAPGSSWRYTARFQGGAAVRAGAVGGKLIYAEGFRQPDAVLLFSQVGTKGNPDLAPEQSRELAALLSIELARGATLQLGGNLTRIDDLVALDPIMGDPVFLYTPVNKGKIDLASGFVEARVTSRRLDAFASWHITGMRESDPINAGIPLARHTAALAAIWRPITDLSLFVRGSFASPRRVHVMTADDPDTTVTTDPTIRSALGLTVTDAFAGVDLELTLDNPLLREHDSPYQLDGSTAAFIERRTGTELRAALRYDR